MADRLGTTMERGVQAAANKYGQVRCGQQRQQDKKRDSFFPTNSEQNLEMCLSTCHATRDMDREFEGVKK